MNKNEKLFSNTALNKKNHQSVKVSSIQVNKMNHAVAGIFF